LIHTYSFKPIPNIPPLDGTTSLITKKSIKEYNAIFIGTIYPFGFEPHLVSPKNFFTAPKDALTDFFKYFYKLIRVDLAFELSSKIFSKIYFGGGLSFGLFSVSFLACYQKVDDIGLHLGKNQIIPDIFLVQTPIRERYRWSYGISITLPIDFAASWIALSVK